MSSPLWILVGSQLLFTTSDLTARAHMRGAGSFSAANFLSPWFLAYMLVRTVATFGQLYVFSQAQLGRTMALFGATSIVLSNVLGLLVLGETLSAPAYVGVALAALAFAVLAFR
jgi:uncharacterized membrane protein